MGHVSDIPENPTEPDANPPTPAEPVTAPADSASTSADSGAGNPPGPKTPAPVTAPRPPVRKPPGIFARAFGWGTGLSLGVVTVFTALSIISSLIGAIAVVVTMAASSNQQQQGNYRTIWGKSDARHTLRAINVNGTILTDASGGSLLSSGAYGYEIAAMIDRITADQADGLVLQLNTPGGSIPGSRAIADAVTRYQERTGKKVLAHVRGMSASGGMYAMASSDEILADHGSLVGSIGVIFGPFSRYTDVTATDGGLLGTGVTTSGGITQYYLSQGTAKDFGNPYRDMTPEERQVYEAGLATEYANFVDFVATHRGIPADTIRSELGAYMFDNERAQQYGLIDGTASVDQAYRRAAELNGLDPAQVKVQQPAAPSTVDQLLGAENRVPGTAQPAGTDAQGRPLVTAQMCIGAPGVLAYHGDPSPICGR